ncbi:hypothetical protein SAMN02746065_1453 [Desulfocicer vacuolatum DSM 3385]|uniref:Uncharacterized protein n=1 Tax=Desulfocicer vacuolatum DSM 3385 TaxID=1121400 RepID=A0A1W2ETX9_9BACT|nr:hypothetical protein [Desulfocicer vacuolatum]SMD13032.1 hypothetical protein SAMN02746065_1453 [Desulfocicer vacuolatum DSM 3385]
MQKTGGKKNSNLTMEGKKVKKSKIIKIVAIAVIIAILPSIGLTGISRKVKVGDFDNQSAEPLIGDFAVEVKETISTLSTVAKALEDVNNGFEDCSSNLGRDSLDKARYTECVIEKAQISRDAYRQSKGDFEKLGRRLEAYQHRTSKAVSQTKQDLVKEQQNLTQAKKSISQHERQAKELIKKIDGSADDQPLTMDQSELIWEVTDGLIHQNNISEMLENATSKLKCDLLELENGSKAVNGLQASIRRVNRNFDYRIDEANQFIRLSRSYSLTQARLMETAAIVDDFNGVKDDIRTMLTHRPDYTAAFHQLGGSSDSLIPQVKPQTIGEALNLLKSLVKKGD